MPTITLRITLLRASRRMISDATQPTMPPTISQMMKFIVVSPAMIHPPAKLPA